MKARTINDEPLMSKYMVYESGRHYVAYVLTEQGSFGFNKRFRTLEGAKRFCLADRRKWQRANGQTLQAEGMGATVATETQHQSIM